MLKGIWSILNSKLGLLIVGFSLTTVIGTFLTDWVQRRAWQYQTQLEQQRQDFEWKRSRKFEILRRKLDEGQKSLEEISDLVNLRFFRLQKVYEEVLSGDIQTAQALWAEYMKVVERWNVKLIINQNKLERLVNKDVARQFNNYETDNPQLKEPASLHGHFYLAHKRVKRLLDCAMQVSCEEAQEVKNEATEKLRSLDYFSDAFVDGVSALFLEQTFALEEFNTLGPKERTDALGAKTRSVD
jgi:hypothetical protein